MKLTFPAHVNDGGQMKYFSQRRFDNEVMIHAGKDVVVTIERKKSKRSNPQNRYYWGVVIQCLYDGMVDQGFARDTVSKELLHEAMKAKYLKDDIFSEQSGLVLNVVKSTSSLSKDEFGAYIEDIKRYAAENLSIYIPDPGEQVALDYG